MSALETEMHSQPIAEPPAYLSRFLDITHFLIAPSLGFSLVLAVYLEVVANDKYQLPVIGSMVLVTCSFFVCLVLLGIYENATEDPGTRLGVRFLKLFLYISAALALCLSGGTAFFPGIAAKEIEIAISAGSGVVVVVVLFCDLIKWPKCITNQYHEAPEPIAVIHHRQMFRFIMLPMLGFVTTLLGVLLRQVYHKDFADSWIKHHAYILYVALTLVVYCVVDGVALLNFYHRANEVKTIWSKFCRATFYAAGCSAWGLTVTTAFCRDRELVVLLWYTIGVTAFFFVFVSTFFDYIRRFLGWLYGCITKGQAAQASATAQTPAAVV